MNADRQFITREKADAMMPAGERVHTFMQAAGPGTVLLGCDVDREQILKGADDALVELAGETATKMNHGLCWYDNGRPVFVATKQEGAP